MMVRVNPKQKWTVILRYPDEATNWPNDHYVAHVEAPTEEGACAVGQRAAAKGSFWADDPESFYPVAVIKGHLNLWMPT